MQRNDDAYLLHFLNIDCKHQSERALTVFFSCWVFFNYYYYYSRPITLCHCLDVHYYFVTAYILILS